MRHFSATKMSKRVLIHLKSWRGKNILKFHQIFCAQRNKLEHKSSAQKIQLTLPKGGPLPSLAQWKGWYKIMSSGVSTKEARDSEANVLTCKLRPLLKDDIGLKCLRALLNLTLRIFNYKNKPRGDLLPPARHPHLFAELCQMVIRDCIFIRAPHEAVVRGSSAHHSGLKWHEILCFFLIGILVN